MGFFGKLFRRKKKKPVAVLSSPKLNTPDHHPEPTQKASSSSPVDLDDTLVDGKEFSTSPTRFEFSAGLDEKKKDDHDDDSSSFNLSTDAEDTEYNNLKHRNHHHTNNNNNITTITTDGEQSSVFPHLLEDDTSFQISKQEMTNLSFSTTSTVPPPQVASPVVAHNNNRSKPFTSPTSEASSSNYSSNGLLFADFDNNKPEVPLSELLAQAKSKRRSNGTTSVNSNTSNSHRNHNKKADTSVSDIIKNLELTNASRSSSTRRKQHQHVESSSEQQNKDEAWLFDEVTGALGPRGIAADLESLSGRSNRSHTSNRSSNRSSKHRKSRKGGSDSVGSKSHGSRRSRYSTRSYLSQMSEQSRSVATDLMRLEAQLAMVGSGQGGGEKSKSHETTGSRHSRRSRPRISIQAPAGKLGIILANKANSKGTVVSGVRTSSVLADKISPGDRIVAIDGEDVSLMTVSEITTIMARKSDFDRTLTVLRTPRNDDRYRN